MTGRSGVDERVIDEALGWQTRLESDDADWDGYITWLEADPQHREAFDAIALVGAAVDDHKVEIAALLQAQQPAPGPARKFRFLFAGGIAAALALVVAVPMFRAPDRVLDYAADAGTSRSVALANGTHVTLSPASRIVVHGKDAARIDLASGEAYFDVRHDPSRTLTVSAGRYRITDIGTRFSVNLSDTAFRVGVSEGTISVTSSDSGQTMQVTAGRQLTATSSDLILSPVNPAEIGSWRAGNLSYTDAPLRLVVADIARYSGKTIVVDPSLEKSHFSGTLAIGDGSHLVTDLAAIMPAQLRMEGERVHIGAAGSSR